MMHTTLRTSLLLGAAYILTTASALAQSPRSRHEVDLAVSYLSVRSNLTPGQFFWQQGGDLDLSATVSRSFGLAANVAGTQAHNISRNGIGLDTFTATFGPNYTWSRPSGKMSVFGQGLVGISHSWNSLFPNTTSSSTSADSFALQVGGGVDLRLSRHLAVRPIQADWVRTHFPNATTNVQNNFRLGAGLVFRMHNKVKEAR